MSFVHAILTLIIFCSSSQASIRKLVREYLEVNMNIKSNEFDIKKSYYNKGFTQAQNDWFLTMALSYEDEEGVGFFNFNQNNTKTRYASLGLSKDSFWGGQLDLSQEVFGYDTREWNTLPAAGVDPYQTKTTITYTQDLGANFFGLEYRTDLNITETSTRKSVIDLTSANQNLLFAFYTNYLNTKLDKTLVALNEEALKRAKRRKSVIARRVRDRLSKRVDLYQAQIAELSQKEALLAKKRSFYENLNNLNLNLHRQTRETEVESYELDSFALLNRAEGKLDKNLDLRSLKESLSLARLGLKKAKRGYWPTIALSGAYSTNALQPNFNEAYKQGSFGSGAQTGTIALNISIPLGMEQASADVAQNRIELKKSELILKKTKIDLDNTIYNLERRISSLKEEINFSKQKRILAKKALKEENRLYLLGKKNIEEVIRSEETLITTEIGLANNLTIYNILLGQYATVKGKLLSFTYQFID